MRIGRHHIDSTVNTIVFAYVGAALPCCSRWMRRSACWRQAVRTLVGSIGLVLAIPVATAIAALVVPAAGEAMLVEPPSADVTRRANL